MQHSAKHHENSPLDMVETRAVGSLKENDVDLGVCVDGAGNVCSSISPTDSPRGLFGLRKRCPSELERFCKSEYKIRNRYFRQPKKRRNLKQNVIIAGHKSA